MNPEHEDGKPAGPGVLVVDDYAPNLTALQALLTPIAWVTAVESGAEALEQIARRDYAVVVLDIQMPRMDGLEVARRMRAGNRNALVPIIFLTASDGGATQVLEGYAAGAVDYLRRPFDPFILQSKVSIFVELSERREQAKHEAAERVRLQAERAAAEQASREKDRFLGVLSHELRTPLTSILLWSDMLLNKNLSPEMVRRGLETVDVCARQEAHMVENVLEMSRLVTGSLSLELGAVNLDEVVEEALGEVAGLAAERQVRITWTPEAAGGAFAMGDRVRLRQVLYNLLENAVKFTPAGGGVEVAREVGPSGVTIRVVDTGVGFAPEIAPDLFTRFGPGTMSSSSFSTSASASTRAHGGLGLGLALAKELMDLHGGSIACASAGVKQGASFTITLPRAASTGTAAGAAARTETGTAAAGTAISS
jgi:signal transduction histidine kinase